MSNLIKKATNRLKNQRDYFNVFATFLRHPEHPNGITMLIGEADSKADAMKLIKTHPNFADIYDIRITKNTKFLDKPSKLISTEDFHVNGQVLSYNEAKKFITSNPDANKHAAELFANADNTKELKEELFFITNDKSRFLFFRDGKGQVVLDSNLKQIFPVPQNKNFLTKIAELGR